MKKLPLTQGKHALIDDDDLGLVAWWSWCFDGQYAAARIHGKKVRLHRFILGDPEGLVDHINRDKLDNRRSNLRVVGYSENAINTPLRSDNMSGHRGVAWDRAGNRWRAYINRNGKRVNIGSFGSLKEAISARREHES